MDIIHTPSYEALSQEAATYIAKQVRTNPDIVLGLATGSTPTGMYKHLLEDHIIHKTSYENVTTFNLDEYIGLKKTDSNSYYTFMRKHLFQHINIKKDKIYIPDGLAGNLATECENYEENLKKNGPVDIQVLGLGENGHIGFNEPGTSFHSRTHIVELTESTRTANARFFPGFDDVPTHAITMGIASIMSAKEIILLVAGKNKAKAFEQLLYGEVSESFPASVLKKHPCVKIIADTSVLEESSIIA